MTLFTPGASDTAHDLRSHLRYKGHLIFGVIAGLMGAGALLLWPWSRRGGRWAVVAAGVILGFTAWNFTLNETNGTGFNVDAPILGVSWADAGSGVLAFSAATLLLSLREREEPAAYVVGAAAIGGLVALLLDIIVL